MLISTISSLKTSNYVTNWKINNVDSSSPTSLSPATPTSFAWSTQKYRPHLPPKDAKKSKRQSGIVTGTNEP